MHLPIKPQVISRTVGKNEALFQIVWVAPLLSHSFMAGITDCFANRFPALAG